MEEVAIEEVISAAANEVCRLCLKYVCESPKCYVIEEYLQNLIFTETGISIDVSDEGLPLNMCSVCYDRLIQFHEVKTTWIKNQQILDIPEAAKAIRDETLLEDGTRDYTEEVVEDEYGYSVDYDEQHDVEYEDLQMLVETEDQQEDVTSSSCFVETPAAQTRPKRARARAQRKPESKSVDKERGKEIYKRLQQKCPECGKVMEKNRLEGHLNKHRNIRPFVCEEDDCGKSFYCKLLFRLHKTSIHTGRIYVCDVCSKTFPSHRSLYAHKLRHTNRDKYQCDFCDRRFNNSNSLKRHQAIHSGTREYICETCNASFYRKFNLDVHIRTVHKKSKPHECEYCDKKFGYARLLRDHMQKIHPTEMSELMHEEILFEVME